jgi:hypothetical protein
MAGLVPAIHVFAPHKTRVCGDAREERAVAAVVRM